jgi:hypothetical protein
MRFFSAILLAALSSYSALAQMSIAQKQEDFRQLVALYDKMYAFYGWKLNAVGFDLLSMQPWMDRIGQTTDDLGYYEIAAQYVGSLRDGHDTYLNPSDFVADLNFRVDLFDGKPLVYFVDTTALPPRRYNIQVGDELISVDGQTPEEIIADYTKYEPDGNTPATRRDLVFFSTVRLQFINPRAANVGDRATVVLKAADGTTKTLTIAWTKSGTPFTKIGPVSEPHAIKLQLPADVHSALRRKPNPSSTRPQALYHALTRKYQLMLKPSLRRDASGVGLLPPVYIKGLPTTFKQRSNPVFFSGTYTANGATIGLLRIPDFCAGDPSCSFDPSTLDFAVSQFQREVTYMKANTDALVVDVSNNPGGYGFYALQLLDRLTDKPYRHAGFALRPQYIDLVSVNQTLEQGGLEQWQVDALTAFRDQIQEAYQSVGGMTGPLPVDFGWSTDPADVSSLSFDHPPITDSKGVPVGYNKPVLLLANDASYSAAELFSAAFQDSQRGPVLGMRTAGLGGSRFDTPTGIYSEAATSVTVAQLLRMNPVSVPDFISAPLIENLGVQPDIQVDYQTRDNLLNNGKTYVNTFTQAVLALIQPK